MRSGDTFGDTFWLAFSPPRHVETWPSANLKTVARPETILYTLHHFDLELCEYVRGNFSFCLAGDVVAERTQELPVRFREYLVSVRESIDSPTSGLSFLLGDDELQTLEDLARFAWPQPDWKTHRELHKQATLCTGVINQELARAEGERWAKASLELTRQLEAKYLSVVEGISIVRDWLWELRRFKRAMGDDQLLPRPEGAFPTPTNPNSLESDIVHQDLTLNAVEDRNDSQRVGNWFCPADVEPPSDYKFGPLAGKKKELAKWILLGK